MVNDTLGYALVTAGVGMGIVFFALVSLSVMMLVIRAVFADRPPSSAAESGRGGAPSREEDAIDGSGNEEPGPEDRDEHGMPRWALSGVVAYLLEEERERTPGASPWTSRPARK